MQAAKRKMPAVLIALALVLAIAVAMPAVATIPAADRAPVLVELAIESPPSTSTLPPSAELPIALPPPAHGPPVAIVEAAPDVHLRVALAVALARVRACGNAENRIRESRAVGSEQHQQNQRLSLRIAPGVCDGPSMYQGFGSSPLNYGDPLGLEILLRAVSGENEIDQLTEEDALLIEAEIRAYSGVQVEISRETGLLSVKGQDENASITARRLLDEMISEEDYEVRIYHSSWPGLGAAYHREKIIRMDLDDLAQLRFKNVDPASAGVGAKLFHEMIHLHFDLPDAWYPKDRREGMGPTIVYNNKIRSERGFLQRGPTYSPMNPSGIWAKSTTFMNEDGKVVGGAFYNGPRILREKADWDLACKKERRKAKKEGRSPDCRERL